MSDGRFNKYKDLSLEQMYDKLGHGRLGEVHVKEGHDTCFEDKCHYCGKWINYTRKDIGGFMAKGQWDFAHQRIKYCGNSVCADFIEQQNKHEERRADEMKRKTREEFFAMLKKGLVS